MNGLEEILQRQKICILDGAFGTMLQNKGYDINDELWSAKFLNENPKVIAQIHTDYLQAGADCIITASYQASFEGFMKKGFSEQKAKELIQSSIFIAQKARDDFWNNFSHKDTRPKPIVAASIGPYGAYLADGSEYSGDYKISDKELEAFHKKRLLTILEAKPDILACETIPSFKEAQILSDLLKKHPYPAWISFSAKDAKHIHSGEEIKECARWFEKQDHIYALGINCTAPEFAALLIEEIRSVSSKPIVLYPNTGTAYNPITKQWQESTFNNTYGQLSYFWYQKGANAIGGCCGTTPKEIEQIQNWVRQ